MSKASIIILTYNNLDYTRMCLDSIYAKTDSPEFEVIIVDNASKDGTQEFLTKYAETKPNLKVVFNSTNLGFSRGNNQGAAEATGDYLVFLNNDVVVTRGWLSTLTSYLFDPEIGMVGPVTNSSGNECQIRVDYSDLDDLDEFAERHTRVNRGRSFEIRMLPFQCVAMRRSLYEEIGPLDERFGIGMFEDDDYALRVTRKGYRILCAEDVFIHHWGSASFSKLIYTDYWDLFKTNLEKLEDKWGISWIPHTQRPEFIPQQYRQLLDGSMAMAGQVNKLIGVKAELEWIKSSNGWAFLQSIMRFRRWLIPEGSKREQVFQSLIRAVRGITPPPRKSPPDTSNKTNVEKNRALLAALARNKPASQAQATEALEIKKSLVGPDHSWLPDRFPWPLVSVILPVYNHADMVEQAARSVLYGSYDNIELILIDDGSEDDIEPVLARLSSNPRVRIYRQPNQKLPRALTHGHQQARGDLITWISADNRMAENGIQSMVEALLANPQAAMVYADVSLIDEQGEPLVDGSYRPQNTDDSQPSVVRLHQNSQPLGYELDNFINACFLYRREAALALEGRFADDLRGMEDYDFWLRLQKCGEIEHIRNETALYHYRVHRRTMSHDLLSKERDRHLERGKMLIEYEARRRAYTDQRWSLLLDERLLPEKKRVASELASQLPVDLPSEPARLQACSKALRFIPSSETLNDPFYVRVYPHSWQLVWQSYESGIFKTLEVWSGVDISPLALKARQYRPMLDLFPLSQGRPIFGCHVGLWEYPLDIKKARQYIHNNTWAYFVFVDIPGSDRPDTGQELVQGLENALYLGALPLGEIYQTYAGFDWLWIPPLSQPLPEDTYRCYQALAFSIARPLLAPSGMDFVSAPYQFFYRDMDGSLTFTGEFERSKMDLDLLDRYLKTWSQVGRMKKLLRFANAVSLDRGVQRPDFGVIPAPKTAPLNWRAPALQTNSLIRCVLVADTLDKGGLEEVIANLARCLPEYGYDPFVLCVKSGGMTADKLESQGVRVYNANGQKSAIRDVLRKEKPKLASTHWADLSFLQVASEIGVPVIETIHNTYVWLDREGWQKEKQRSRYFYRYAAVSDLVRQYTLKWNTALRPEWISVLPNGVDSSRLALKEYREARRELGIQEGETLFISIGSYHGGKNQLGLLAAFDQISREYPQTRLFCIGQIGDSEYHAQVVSFLNSLKSKDRVGLFEFRSDVGLLLSGADALVINSFFEGWSMAATEALIAGVPLVHTECGSGRELVGEMGERGFLIPNPAGDPLELTWEIIRQAIPMKQQRSTPALVEAMSEIVLNREEWRARRSGIRNYSVNAFGMESFLQRYQDLFNQVLEKKG
jgi:GT2 family glycosyltransferase/glycosyltransferase involved in cell wall biosynthesis